MRPTLLGLQKMLILSESNVRQCLVMKDCLEASRQALTALAQDKAIVPTRLGLPYPPSDGDSAVDWSPRWAARLSAFEKIIQTTVFRLSRLQSCHSTPKLDKYKPL